MRKEVTLQRPSPPVNRVVRAAAYNDEVLVEAQVLGQLAASLLNRYYIIICPHFSAIRFCAKDPIRTPVGSQRYDHGFKLACHDGFVIESRIRPAHPSQGA